MGDIINDGKSGNVGQYDKTAKVEQNSKKRLLELVKKNLLTKEIYDRIRPTGSQRPRMYGLPKTPKPSTPLTGLFCLWSVLLNMSLPSDFQKF